MLGARRAPLHAAEKRARPARGSRHRAVRRVGAAGLDAAVHRRAAAPDRAVLRTDSRGVRVRGDRGIPDGRRRDRVPAPQAVGRAEPDAAADRGRAAAEADVDPGRVRVPDQSALAGPAVPLDAGRVRGHVAGAVRGTAAHRRPLRRRGAQVSRRAEPADRPAPQHAGAPRHDQPRQAVRRRHAGRHRRPHAGDDAGRPPGDALQEGRRAVRRDRPGRADRPLDAGRHQRRVRALARRRHGPAVQPRRRARARRAAVAQPLQPAARGEGDGDARAGLRDRRRAEGDGRGREARAAADGADRPRRPVARVQEVRRRDLLHVRAGADLHLPRAVGAVRELRPPVRDHAVGAAVDDRRAVPAVADRRHAQHLQPGRSGDAGRPHHQARHPDRRVLEPAPRQGRGASPTPSSTPRRCGCGRS